MSQELIEAGANVRAAPPAKLRAIWIYLTVLATVFAVASLALGVAAYQGSQHAARQIEQLQRDTNDNLCNQQAYEGGTACEGGDANGGSGF